MASYGPLVKKGRNFKYEFRAENPRLMTNRQIRKYFREYGQGWDERENFEGRPDMIASPIDRPKRGIEVQEGYTGNLKYFGQRTKIEGDEGEWISAGATYSNRRMKIDTYYNKVFEEAVRRGLVKITDQGLDFPFLRINLRDIFGRDSLQGIQMRNMLADIGAKNTMRPRDFELL